MIKFGPAGSSQSFIDEGHKRSVEMPAWLKARGLDLFEYSFGRGVNIGEAAAKEIAEEAKKNGIEMTVHAPYFVNFASEEEPKVENSYRYIRQSLDVLQAFGGNRCVVHTATKGKSEYKDAVLRAYHRLERLAEILETEYPWAFVCPETMGKRSQIGDVADILGFCKISKQFIPTFDFGHINARECGVLKTKDDYRRIIDELFDSLGEDRAKKLHIHFSKIEYTDAGELRHLTFSDNVFGPDFEPLAELLTEYKMDEAHVVCESNGTQAEDAAEMKRITFGK